MTTPDYKRTSPSAVRRALNRVWRQGLEDWEHSRSDRLAISRLPDGTVAVAETKWPRVYTEHFTLTRTDLGDT